MNPGTIGNSGGSQAHENMQPYPDAQLLHRLIGVFPSRN